MIVEVPLFSHGRGTPGGGCSTSCGAQLGATGCPARDVGLQDHLYGPMRRRFIMSEVQEYLTHKKQPPPPAPKDHRRALGIFLR